VSLVDDRVDQGEGMISVQEWAEIRRLHLAEGMSKKAIARKLGLSRNTVRAALSSEAPPNYHRTPPASKLDPYRAEVASLLRDEPHMPAKRVAEIIAEHGFCGGQTIVNEYVRRIRPLFQTPRVFQRTTYSPGEIAQWDLWVPPKVPVGFGVLREAHVVVGTLGYSKVGTGALVFAKTAPDILWALHRGLERLGGVPRTCVFDREGSLCLDKSSPNPRPTEPLLRFSGAIGFGVHFRPKSDPQGKGVVERMNGYLETSFLPGRRFHSPEDFQSQLDEWFGLVANVRFHRTLRCRPLDRWAEDRSALRALPAHRPDTSWRFHAPVRPDPYVRVDTNDYSVHPDAVGQVVEVRATQDRVVCVTKDGAVVADHHRSFAPHRTITAAEHGRAIRLARGATREPLDSDVEVRDLGVYDRAFGVSAGDLPAPFRERSPR
jgi:transposase